MITPCVYLMASRRQGTLYVGSTGDLVRRTWQHKGKFVNSFTKDYDVDLLVWYEIHATMESAQTRERAIKKWRRAWKIRLIEQQNPEWRDLYHDII